jgi:hypothetical protein
MGSAGLFGGARVVVAARGLADGARGESALEAPLRALEAEIDALRPRVAALTGTTTCTEANR